MKKWLSTISMQQWGFFFTGLGGTVAMLAGYQEWGELLQVPVIVGFVGNVLSLVGATLSRPKEGDNADNS